MFIWEEKLKQEPRLGVCPSMVSVSLGWEGAQVAAAGP